MYTQTNYQLLVANNQKRLITYKMIITRPLLIKISAWIMRRSTQRRREGSSSLFSHDRSRLTLINAKSIKCWSDGRSQTDACNPLVKNRIYKKIYNKWERCTHSTKKNQPAGFIHPRYAHRSIDFIDLFIYLFLCSSV